MSLSGRPSVRILWLTKSSSPDVFTKWCYIGSVCVS